jgi:hypothetical protein
MSERLVLAPGSIEPDTVPCVQLYRPVSTRNTPESADLNLAFSVQFPGLWSTELKVRLPVGERRLWAESRDRNGSIAPFRPTVANGSFPARNGQPVGPHQR